LRGREENKDIMWRYCVDVSARIISARRVERRKNDHHLKLWRHDKERDGRSQVVGEVTSIAPAQLNGQRQEIVLTYISQGRFMKVLFFRVGKSGEEEIYTMFSSQPSPLASSTSFYYSFSSRPKLYS
jgi:hypothetical protein